MSPIDTECPTRTEYRRRFRTACLGEMNFQTNKRLGEIMGGTNAVYVDIGKGGVLSCTLESTRCNLNDLVYLSKDKVNRFNSDQFALIRACRGEIDPSSPSADFNRLKNQYRRKRGPRQEHRKNLDESRKIKIEMIGKKSIDHFVGKWQVHSVLNLTTFERIHNALQRRGKLPLEDLLLAQNPPATKLLEPLPDEFPVRKNKLNQTQLKAITSVCSDMDETGFYCIHGPPGTGKTTTLLEMVYSLTRVTNPGEIILTGTCNTTVRDLVCRIMADKEVLPEGGYLMVVGHQVQIEKEVYQYALFSYLSRTIKQMIHIYFRLQSFLRQLDRHADFDHLDKTRGEREQFEDWLKRLAKLPCRPTKIMEMMEQLKDSWEDMWTEYVLKQITGEPTNDADEVKDLLKACIKEVERWCMPRTLTPILIQNASLIACTNSQGMSEILKNWPFKYVLEDEAAQCIEPESLLAMRQTTKKVVLFGDPYQLSGFVQSPVAKNARYDRSLMKRLMEAGFPSIFLDTQHRMHPEISQFPSRYIYKGELKDGDSVKKISNDYPLKPYQLIHIANGKEAFAESAGKTRTRCNMTEVSWVRNWLKKKLVPAKDVAVITPYQGQRQRLSDQLLCFNGVSVQTVDSFQGQESEVVILSLVRTHGGIGFLGELERLNVALTRAKRAFIIVGNLKHFSKYSENWSNLVDDARQRGCLVGMD
jgi:senataxin